jgi:DNA-directed RNA polymerase specialized sigma24 family protein
MTATSNELSEMDQYALQNIRCRVHELVACQLFREDDREDLEQQLFLEYWKRIGGFKRERGTYKTFINRLIRNRAASLALKAIRAGVGRIASLTDDDESECPIEASAGLDDASRGSTAEAVQARLDVEKVLSSVAPPVRLLAEEIRTTDFAGVAATIGTKLGLTSRRTYQFREQLRAAFRASGLAPTWQGAR